MHYGNRIKKLSWFFLLLCLVLLAVLALRMTRQGEELTRRAYLDQPMLDLIQRLAEEGIISPAEEGVKIDENRLKARVPRPGTRSYILNRKQYMAFSGNALEVDPAAVRVTNRRLIHRGGRLDRGRILDRHGTVLARTVQSKTGRAVREYPMGPATLPLLGLAHPIYGLKGLELLLSSYLEGRTEAGFLNTLYRFFTGKKKFYDAVLTIDGDLQRKAFELLEGKTGAVVVIKAGTGAILAAASSPSFDPATPAGKIWDQTARQGYKGPFANRALQRRYPPGSTFKPLAAVAWMEHPDFDEKWGLECRGRHPKYRIREYRGKTHGWASLKTAVRLSCNVFFADVGVRMGPHLLAYAERFGFNERWPFFDGNDAGDLIAPSRAFNPRPDGAPGIWQPIDFKRNPKLVAQAGVGQNVIQATPLQMALAGATLANGGEFMAPRLIRHIRYVKEGDENRQAWLKYQTSEPRKIRTVCKRDTADAILAMMATVMEQGTGHRLKRVYRLEGEYRIGPKLPEGAANLLAGKTGTAETAKGMPDHSWFLAIGPTDEPRYAVAVIVEHGGLGARTAGPIAVRMMFEALKANN